VPKRKYRDSSSSETERCVFPLSTLERNFIKSLIAALKKGELEQNLELHPVVFGPRLFNQLLAGLPLHVGSSSQQSDIFNSKQQSYLIAPIHQFLAYARLKRYESTLNICCRDELEESPGLRVTAGFIINEYLKTLCPTLKRSYKLQQLIERDINEGSCFIAINFLNEESVMVSGGSEVPLEDIELEQSLDSIFSDEFVDSYQGWGDDMFPETARGNEEINDLLDSDFPGYIDFANFTSGPEGLFTTTDSKAYTLVEAKLCKNQGDEVKSGEKIFAMTLIGPGGVAIDYDVYSPADGFVSHYASWSLPTELKPNGPLVYVHTFNAFGPQLLAGLKTETQAYVESVLRNEGEVNKSKLLSISKRSKVECAQYQNPNCFFKVFSSRPKGDGLSPSAVNELDPDGLDLSRKKAALLGR
jgi:hypothetical protein